MILPNYPSGDILIKRVANGWMAVSRCDNSDGELSVFVYEDPEDTCWMEKSLAALFSDQFKCFMQDELRPGIKVEVSPLTRLEEDNAKEQHH